MHWTSRTTKKASGVMAAVLIPALAASFGQMQGTAFDRNTIAIDPAHGGSDSGARISDQLLEKDVTLAFEARLRSLLAARGFMVVSTRPDDTTAGSTDQRAETLNKAHAVACLVLHASGSGSGVFVATSTIGSALGAVAQAGAVDKSTGGVVPWDRAQEAWVPQSLRLADQIRLAVLRSSVPVAMGRVALRPLENLMCPAISIEVRPIRHGGSDQTPLSDERYQQRLADAIAGALVFWRNQAQQPEYVPVQRPAAELTGPDLAAPRERMNSGL